MKIRDSSVLLERLTGLTGDLRSLPHTPAGSLDEARIAVARALAAGQPEAVTRAGEARPQVALHTIAAEHGLSLESAVEAALAYAAHPAHPADAPEFLVARRELPIGVTGMHGITPEWAAGRAVDASIGPFIDTLGRPVWIDLFQVVAQTRLVRAPGAAPFLTLPLRGLSFAGNRFTLPGGSVWIASRQIAPTAPAGAYTGLRIRGGTLTFSHPLLVSNHEIVVPPAVTCTLDLELDPAPLSSGTGAGADARDAAVFVPKNVTFVFSAAGAKLRAATEARVRVYGTTVALQPTSDAPSYVAHLARIFVPARTDAASFAIADVRSDEFRPAGEAVLASAAWTLPVAVVSPSSLGHAAGAGGIALTLHDGLTVTWRGQPAPATAGPVTLLADVGLITFAALTGHGRRAHETIPLWSRQPGQEESSRIDLRWAPRFPLTFFSAATGAELLVVAGAIDGHFDRPITVAGKRVLVQAKSALIFFVASPGLNGVIIEAVLDPPPPPARALALAIANSVFRTSAATTLLLVAEYDGVHSPRGGAVLGFGMQFLLPTLPDPYAGNNDVPLDRLRDLGTNGTLSAFVFWSPDAPPLLTYALPAETPEDVRAGRAVPLILLDLSTNVDQFGVAWLPTRLEAAATPLTVESMYLVRPSQSVYVVTVPAVQWEPVFTETQLPPPSPPFPTPVTFTDTGGPTAIGVQSMHLVRVAPAPALDFLVENFTTSATPQTANARLTLPFGIEASATLKKPGVSGPRGATVEYIRPDFSGEAVKGGYQISVRAVDPAAPDSPSLEGSTMQRTDNLRPLRTPPAPLSVLDTDAQEIFNAYLGPDAKTAQVPVTRIDLSGYGESLFSRWVNPADDAVAVSQARFDVLIGRTSLEVVQVRSILYPYAVRVVRTITIQRKNSGAVVRKDSGWQASTDGEYLFPGGALVTHPGVIRKIVNVTNIRDTGQLVDLTGGAELACVVFDGDLVIEHTVKGAAGAGVPARGQIGYVQLKPTGDAMLTPAQYEELIQKVGPMGGNVDCTFDVGASGQLMKLGRVGVGATQGLGGAEFVMTAWGSPQFPQGGQWTFLRQTGSGTAPEVVDRDRGIPLIRAGAAPAPPPLHSPYQFADPVDLGPLPPRSDYGIVHATGTQRVFFPRPKIEANADRITSVRPPILADPYSLANSVGFFPRVDAAVPFPDANYALVIAGGNYRLDMPSPSFPVTVGQRTIAEASGVRSYVDYAGSVARLAIDTAQAIPWSFQLEGVNLAASSGLLGEVMRVNATVDAAANLITNLADPKMLFGGALGVVQDILEFLRTLGFPSPLTVSMTNKLEIKAVLRIPLDDELNAVMPPGGIEFDDTEVAVSLVIASPLVEAEFEFGATMLIPTPFDPLKAVGRIDLDLKMSTDTGNTFTLTVGAGLGVSFNVAGFGCKAYFLESMFLIAGETVLGFGVGLLIKGSIDLEVVSVDVSVEAKMAIFRVLCADTTIFGVAQLTFAVEVSICWVIDIDFSVTTEIERNLNNGSCDLPDVL